MVGSGTQAIAGEVYEVDEPTLNVLDRLEGHPRFYRRARVILEDGATAEAYLLSPEHVAGRPVIGSGSWRVCRGAGDAKGGKRMDGKGAKECRG